MVFVLPKHLRRPFYSDRKLLTGLCRSAVVATHEFYRTGLGQNDLRVGMVVVPLRSREEEDISQVPPGWDESEPA